MAERQDPWSREEVEATVADYFDMLAAELTGTPYSKTDHRRTLARKLHDRSDGSIEFKHCNISAVLIELGFPYISGYKRRDNYQALLYDVVADRLQGDRSLQDLAAQDVDLSVQVPTVDDILRALVNPPKREERAHRAAEPRRFVPRFNVNYLEREAHNRTLGAAGEEFILNFERARLIHEGKERLAAKIEHGVENRRRWPGVRHPILRDERRGSPDRSENDQVRAGHAVFRFSERGGGVPGEGGRLPSLPALRVSQVAAAVHARRADLSDVPTPACFFSGASRLSRR